jgi:C1A family cysteine protease
MGWIPDVPSVKDYTEEHPDVAPLLAQTSLAGAAPPAAAPTASAAAPAPKPVAQIDLRPCFSPIEDQGQLGSCTANAAVALIEYMERKALGKHIDASRLFVYKVTRNMMKSTGDSGAEIRTALGAIACFGAPPEEYWPYDPSPEHDNKLFDKEPTAFCYAFASNFQSIKYLRLDPSGLTPAQVLASVKSYLASGLPAMFGFPAYDEFMEPLAGGLIAFPGRRSRNHGGHAIVAAGFDDDLMIGADKGALLIRNSWGEDWGDKGYGWLSYRYVTEGLALDWWTVISQKWVDTGQF